MKLFDSHTHLNSEPLWEDWQGYMQKFIDVGGVGLINSGASESYNVQGVEIAKIAERDFKNCIVKATLGRHPLECVEGRLAADEISAKMQWLKELYLANKHYVVAIGETGIDVHYSNGLETLKIQKELFIQHCNLARELKLPLVVHSRDAFLETFEILKNYTDLTIYFHCRGYGPQEFEILHSKFEKLFIGFCGNVTYKNAQALRDTLAIVSLQQLLLETDAPYLTPQIIRGETNHPANVKYMYEFVSEILQINPESLSQQVETNFHTIYKI
ncbi:MAG: TatD family hydrolase [candidate division SR1 bacterium]|nr:TatD family hydrolase [candidate division SR1 bacterium]